MNNGRLKPGDDGQAYVVEATITAILITIVIIFIAPSIATPTQSEQIQKAEEEKLVEAELDRFINKHQKNGDLKSLTINYLVNNWQIDKPGEDAYDVEPRNDKYADSHARIPGDSDDRSEYYVRPSGPVGANIEQIENEHDVWIAAYIIPEPTSDNPNPEAVKFIESEVNDNVIAEQTTEIVLFDNDRYRTSPDAQSTVGSPRSAASGEGIQLIDGAGNPDVIYPVDKSDEEPDSVYNTIEIQVVAYEDPSIAGAEE